MGGSTLGTLSIYDFLKTKIRKKFEFIENLKKNISNKKSKKYLNLVVSKSGETLETIINSNIYIKKIKIYLLLIIKKLLKYFLL